MSIKFMAKVYELAIDSDTREILMALADHADDEGYSIFPSVARIAWKIGDGAVNEEGEYKTTRTVQRRIKELIDMGALVELKPSGFHRATEYGLDLSVFPKKAAFKPKGDRLSSRVSKGDKNASKGDRALSPEPSLNVHTHTQDDKQLQKPEPTQPTPRESAWKELAEVFPMTNGVAWQKFDELWQKFPDPRRHTYAIERARKANPAKLQFYLEDFCSYDPDKPKTWGEGTRPAPSPRYSRNAAPNYRTRTD
jgi:hypothetical protein